jgi:mono/diheme cytochrome c family protein
MRIWWVALGVGLVVGLVCAAEAGESWRVPEGVAAVKNPLAGDPAAVGSGKKLYEDRCADCHGLKGRGDGPASIDLDPKPGDLSKPALREQPDGVLFWKISEGKKPMPPYKTKLTEEQRWQLINYLRTLGPKG